ncbi:MAG: DNA-3-methyladenine glycosylase [Ignavibacteria bacterium]
MLIKNSRKEIRSCMICEIGIYLFYLRKIISVFNVVCMKKGIANAVLVRAVEPIDGIDFMEKQTEKIKNPFDLTTDSAKLCMAILHFIKRLGQNWDFFDSLYLQQNKFRFYNPGLI